MAKSRVDELRAEAKAIRKNLTSKVSRIARVQNVNIAGTNLDPRIPAAKIDSMNTRQLQSYLNKAHTFLDRRTGYVRGKGGVPLPLSEWQAYKAVERANNRLARKRLEKYGDIQIPGTTMTAREREGNRSRNPRMRNTASNRPIDIVIRENAEGFSTVEGLRKIRRQLEKRLTKKHLVKSMKKTRQTAIKAYTKMGNQAMLRSIRNMSDEMLDFLWNYGGLAESTFSRYENLVSSTTETLEARGFEKVSADAESDIEETLKWAETFDKFKKS